MNAAIERLAREIGLLRLTDGGGPEWASPNRLGVSDVALEAFAQAVAQRCADLCRAEMERRLRAAKALGRDAGALVASVCEDAICEEFGIEGSALEERQP